MKEKWIGVIITDTGSVRNHTRIHDTKEEACSILKGEKPPTHKAYVFKAMYEIRSKEAPVEYISLEKDLLDDTDKLKEDFPLEPKSSAKPVPLSPDYEMDVTF